MYRQQATADHVKYEEIEDARQWATITRDILIPGPTQPGLSQNRQNVIWVPLSLIYDVTMSRAQLNF